MRARPVDKAVFVTSGGRSLPLSNSFSLGWPRLVCAAFLAFPQADRTFVKPEVGAGSTSRAGNIAA